MNTTHHPSWWHGKRGEWLVVIQSILISLIFIGPSKFFPSQPWPFIRWETSLILGSLLLLLGGALFAFSARQLGSNLTTLPSPKEGVFLVRSGPYRFIRHPIYSGVIISSFGWGTLFQSWFTLFISLLLVILFDIKSRYEERWLTKVCSDYPTYKRHVRRFIPFVY